MTLNDFKKTRKEDLFLAVIKREMNWKDAEKVFFTLPGYSNPVSAQKILEIAVEEALFECKESVTPENRKKIEEEVKQSITPNLEEWYPVILAKYENGYLDLSKMEELDSTFQIVCQIPINEYYKELEYSFEEDQNGPYLNIDMEPFNDFTKDYENGKFL